MSKRLKRTKFIFGDVVLPIVYHLVSFLFPEECGQLRNVCKQMAQCVTLSRQFPTPKSFLMGVADYRLWPKFIHVLQSSICIQNHLHIVGLFFTPQQQYCHSFDILFFERECYLFVQNRSSTIVLPSLQEIGTRPLGKLGKKLADEFLRLFKSKSNRAMPLCDMMGERMVVTCATKGQMCQRSEHNDYCFLYSNWS